MEFLRCKALKLKKGRTTRISILTGEFEPSTTELIKNEVDEGMIFFDIGANIGWYSLLCSKIVGKTGHIYSFEPDPYLFEIIKENIVLNNLKNITVFPYAVSNKTAKEHFSLNDKQDGDNRLGSKAITDKIIEVQTISIDDFCNQHNVKPDFIKMDIQGSEPKAFQGMKETISKNSKIKIITEVFPEAIEDVGSSTEEFIDSLEKSGFTILEIPEETRSKLEPINKQYLLDHKDHSPNLYCYFEK